MNDVGFYKSRANTLQFPPDNFNQKKMDYFSRYQDLPANAINVNTNMYPINTITGLQYFLGKPMNMRVYRERFRPRLGLGKFQHMQLADWLKLMTEITDLLTIWLTAYMLN